MERYFCKFLLIGYGVCCLESAVFAADIENYDVIDNYSLIETTNIRNYGTYDVINTNNKALTIYNYGTVGIINSSGVADIIQNVPDINALRPIHVSGSGFKVNITDVQNANLQDIKNLGATEVYISNSSIIINDFADWRNWAAALDLGDNNTLYLANPETVISGEEIKGIHGNGTRIILLDTDSLYKVTLVHDSGAYLINIYKENNVANLFDDERGDLLQDLQFTDENNPLLGAMRNAKNRQELEHIMQSSYRFNPAVLMRPVNTLNQLSLMNLIFDKNLVYGGLSGFYIGSKTTDGFGLDLSFGGKSDDFYMMATLNLSRFNYGDNLNDFDGFIYGGNIKVKKSFDDFWVHGLIGASGVKFKTDTLYYNHKIYRNPVGFSGYGALDVGYDFHMSSDVLLSPFVGGVGDYESVVDYSDTDITMRFGGNIIYSYVIDNLKYEYTAMAGVAVTGDILGKIAVGFMSELDNAGVSLNVDLLNNEYDLHYKISITGKVLF